MTRTLGRLPVGVVKYLDNLKFWVAVAYFALAAVVVWLAVLTTRTAHASASAAKEQAIRQATIKADYRDCLRSIPSLRAITLHVEGINELAEILVQNSKATLKSFPASDPQQPTRRKNLIRLELARRKVAAVTSFPVPTRATCEAKRVIAELRG